MKARAAIAVVGIAAAAIAVAVVSPWTTDQSGGGNDATVTTLPSRASGSVDSSASVPAPDVSGVSRPASNISAASAPASDGSMGSPPAPSSSMAAIPQFLQGSERARITGVAADHDPMARGTAVRLALEVEIVSGMHVNANPPSEEWLIPVEASLEQIDGMHVVDAFYPEAESRKFPYAEQPFLVYEGTFVIGLVVALDDEMPAGGRELEIVLDYQACNDEACFAPAQTSVKLPVMVVAEADDARAVSSPLIERAPFPRDEASR